MKGIKIMKIKEILKANICAFGETIFDQFSLDDADFAEALDFNITSNNYETSFEEYVYQLQYDSGDIDNQVSTLKNKNKDYDYLEIMNIGRKAFINTITDDKTINAEAFIDNIIKEVKKINKQCSIMYTTLLYKKILKNLHTNLDKVCLTLHV